MWWIAGFVSLAVMAFAIITFNDLIAARNRVRKAWSNIDVQLQRRYDLVPQLVAIVKGYAAHERATFEEVAQLRNRAISTAPVAQRGEIETQLQVQVTRLLALQESNPDLKASDNFAQLQRDLVDVEDRLQTARQEYNETIREFNTQIENFPDLLLARPFGFRPLEFFQAQDREAMQV